MRTRSVSARGARRAPLATIALSALVVVGCGADDGEPMGAPAAGSGESTVDAGGFGPALAGLGGDRLFVWGGLSVSDPTSQNRADGMIVSLPSGERAEVPEAPFDVPIANPRAAAHGVRVLVVGQSCEDWVDADEGRRCLPGDLLGAVFDAGTQVWAPLPSDGLAAASGSAVTVDVSSAGVALISSAARPLTYVAVDIDSAAATVLPRPPVSVDDDQEAISTVACVTATDVLVAERTAPPGYEAGAGQRPSARLHAFPLEGGAWRTLASPPGIWDPVMTCSDAGALLSNGAGVNFGLAWLRVDDGSWHEVTPPAGSPTPYSVRSRRGDGVVLFDGTGAGRGLAYRDSDDEMTPVSGEPAPFDCDGGQCIAVSGQYVGGASRASRTPPATNIFWFEP